MIREASFGLLHEHKKWILLLLLEKRRRIAPEQIVNSRRFKAAATEVNAPLTSESRKLV